MKRKISLILVATLVLSLALVIFTACNGGNNGNASTDNGGSKQIPVYQGMTITPATKGLASSVGTAGAIYLSEVLEGEEDTVYAVCGAESEATKNERQGDFAPLFLFLTYEINRNYNKDY